MRTSCPEPPRWIADQSRRLSLSPLDRFYIALGIVIAVVGVPLALSPLWSLPSAPTAPSLAPVAVPMVPLLWPYLHHRSQGCRRWRWA